jgi:sugar phosphate permease
MDIVIMPIMVIMYVLNYLDRQNIASAKLADIEEDLGLSQVQYQTAVSILFVGYSMLFLSMDGHASADMIQFSCRSLPT